MSVPKRHHYIPKFYLKQWVGNDGRLCEFSRPHKVVRPRMTHPSGTGYQENLYSVEGLPSELVSWLEDVFFRIADQGAADALAILRGEKIAGLTNGQKSAWSRFVMSLLQRNPEKIIWLREQWQRVSQLFEEVSAELYPTYKQTDEPDSYEEYVNSTSPHHTSVMLVQLIQGMIDMPTVGKFINNMRWNVITFDGIEFSLLTSDRPVVIENSLKDPKGFMALPLDPVRLFVATANLETEHYLRTIPSKKFVSFINNRVSSQAKKFVYDRNDKQLRFVENRLGRGVSQFLIPTENEILINKDDIRDRFILAINSKELPSIRADIT